MVKKIGFVLLLLLGLATAAYLYYPHLKVNKSAQNKEKSTQLIAFVASNAQDPFKEITATFEKAHPNVSIKPSFAGTQVLTTQIENGAKADVFLSADKAHIHTLKDKKYIDEYAPISANREVIIVPKDNPAHIENIEDLAKKKVKLVIGVESVPIGKYTLQIFNKVASESGKDYTKNVLSQVVSKETNVKQVVQKVVLGEAEAGIVYKSDVSNALKDKVVVIEIPEKFNVVSTNYIGAISKSPHSSLAKQLIDFIKSSEGQQIFKKFGYESIPTP